LRLGLLEGEVIGSCWRENSSRRKVKKKVEVRDQAIADFESKRFWT
jgi:hypothetical protein